METTSLGMSQSTIIAAVIGLIVLFAVILMYNSLVKFRNMATNAFGDLDALLKQRYDVIPNFIAMIQCNSSQIQSIIVKKFKMSQPLIIQCFNA